MSRAKALRALVPALAALVVLAFAATARADYEQVGNFVTESKEAEQFSGSFTGGAVNVSGVGGVEPGSVYFSNGAQGNRILRYGPKGQFKEAWGWGIEKNSSLLNPQFERCGPARGTECFPDGVGAGAGGTVPVSEENTTYCGAATDPAGDLYVVDREGAGRVYGPGGSLLTEFKFNGNKREICNLAVDSTGAIYAVARQVGSNALSGDNPAEVLELTPVGGAYPPTSATKYTNGSTIYHSGIVAAATNYGIGSLTVDPANQHLYATEAAGNEMQDFKNPEEPFKLRCEGHETSTLPANAKVGEIKAALEAAPVSCGTVKVAEEGMLGYLYRGVVFEGPLAETHVGKLEVIKAGGNEQAVEFAVGSSSPHISVYQSDGTRLETINPGISGASYYGIGVYGTNGDIYVADKAHNKAYVLDFGGSLKTEITASGCEKGAFSAMEDPTLAVDQSNGNVLVSDVNGHGVVDEFNSSGSCLLSVDRPFSEAGPSAIAIDNSGGADNRVAYVASKSGATGSVFAYAPPSGSSRAELPALSHEVPGSFSNPRGIAIDQQTGYVYVLNSAEANNPEYKREHDLVEVFSADGSELIAHFGDAGVQGETIEAGPEKLHGFSGIAVDESGKVYIGDSGSSQERAMCFRPETAGNYHHYVYCGRSQDVELNGYVAQLALDDAGHLYRGDSETIGEYSLAEPSTLLCTYNTNGQAQGMTVNPETGEVFYFLRSKKSVYRLAPCDPGKGKFEEAQAPVKTSPATNEIVAMAINPNLAWSPSRPHSVLYAVDRASHEIGGVTHSGLGYVFAPAEVHPPAVLAEFLSDIRTTSSVLHAEVDPRGFGTHYVFQYLSEAQYEANSPGERFAGAMEAPAGGGEIGSGSVGKVATAITGLTPDTAYRFRVIATSQCNGETGAPCVSEGEASAFATYPLFPPGLPDHRVYEMVSPAQKHGGEVLPAEPNVSSCPSRSGIVECKPKSFGNTFPMQSSPDGEALVYEGQPFNPFEGAVEYDSYVSRRTSSGWQTTALIPAQPPSGVKQFAFDAGLDQGLLRLSDSNLALQPTSQPGTLTPLLSEGPPNRTTTGPNAFTVNYGGHSADFSRVFFAANDTLTEATPFAPEPPDPGASKNDLYEWHEGQLSVVNVAPGNNTVLTGASYASTSPDTNAVSEDGSRAYFKDEAGNLYVRESGEATRLINDPGHFLSATPDGSEVLLSDGCLYSIESESCTDLTEGQGGFKGILGQSKDLSRIYFADGKALTAGAEAGTCTQAPGGSQQAQEEQEGKVPTGLGCNLYLYEAGVPVRFIATLPAWEGVNSAGLNDWIANPAERTAEASPQGRFLAFASTVRLTGYDNVGLCGQREEKTVDIPCNEAFLYDSASGRLTCASCNPTGEAPLGNTTLRRISGTPEQLPQPRYLTDEGRLYFDSQDSLVARDTNEGVEDVYEYEPRGMGAQGTCEREAGCTRLISAGTEPVDSNLIAVDETGKNVFFDTRDKLALKDKDELLDVYDAREGGGIAAESEIARAECQGENCQTPVSPPNDPTPSSSTFEGAGNVKEAPAAKKHAKKKHAKKHKKKAKKQARTANRNHGGAK
jgi:hypothetical protein